jgi:hypothetical protein
MKKEFLILKLWASRLSFIGIIALLVMSIIIPYIYGYEGKKIWIDISFAIGIAIFSTLSISKYFQGETTEFLFKAFEMQKKLNSIGIIDFPENNNIQYMDFETSKELVIVMNDGKNFITNNAENLQKRFQKDSLVTTFIFLDFENNVVEALGTANEKSNKGMYKEKIEQSIEDIKIFRNSNSNHEFKIYLYPKGYFRTSIVLTETFALVGLYRNSPGKTNTPLHMLFSKFGKEYHHILKDVEQLKNKSRSFSLTT